MYWLLDFAVIALFLIVFFGGLRHGITGMLLGVGAFFVRFIYTMLVMAIFVVICELTGLVDALSVPLVLGLGYSTIYDSEMLANILALVIYACIGLYIGIFTLYLIVRAIRRGRIKRGVVHVAIVDRILGMIVAVALFLAFMYALMAFLHSIINAGGLPSLADLFIACPVTGLFYRNNMLVPMLDSTKIAHILVNLINGNFTSAF